MTTQDTENLRISDLSQGAIVELRQRLNISTTDVSEIGEALCAFQRLNKIPETGLIDALTSRELEKICISVQVEIKSVLNQEKRELALTCNKESLSESDWEKLKQQFTLSDSKNFENELIQRLLQFQIKNGFEPTGFLDDNLRRLFSLEIKEIQASAPLVQQTVKLTAHFSWDEFISVGDKVPVPQEYYDNIRFLCEQLEILRKALGNRRIKIVSGWRSPWWNQRVGASENSPHLLGLGADFVVDGVKPSAVRRVLENLIENGQMHDGGVGRYANFTHYDVGESRRWNN